jgi:hypothetical protein
MFNLPENRLIYKQGNLEGSRREKAPEAAKKAAVDPGPMGKQNPADDALKPSRKDMDKYRGSFDGEHPYDVQARTRTKFEAGQARQAEIAREKTEAPLITSSNPTETAMLDHRLPLEDRIRALYKLIEDIGNQEAGTLVSMLDFAYEEHNNQNDPFYSNTSSTPTKQIAEAFKTGKIPAENVSAQFLLTLVDHPGNYLGEAETYFIKNPKILAMVIDLRFDGRLSISQEEIIRLASKGVLRKLPSYTFSQLFASSDAAHRTSLCDKVGRAYQKRAVGELLGSNAKGLAPHTVKTAISLIKLSLKQAKEGVPSFLETDLEFTVNAAMTTGDKGLETKIVRALSPEQIAKLGQATTTRILETYSGDKAFTVAFEAQLSSKMRTVILKTKLEAAGFYVYLRPGSLDYAIKDKSVPKGYHSNNWLKTDNPKSKPKLRIALLTAQTPEETALIALNSSKNTDVKLREQVAMRAAPADVVANKGAASTRKLSRRDQLALLANKDIAGGRKADVIIQLAQDIGNQTNRTINRMIQAALAINDDQATVMLLSVLDRKTIRGKLYPATQRRLLSLAIAAEDNTAVAVVIDSMSKEAKSKIVLAKLKKAKIKYNTAANPRFNSIAWTEKGEDGKQHDHYINFNPAMNVKYYGKLTKELMTTPETEVRQLVQGYKQRLNKDEALS